MPNPKAPDISKDQVIKIFIEDGKSIHESAKIFNITSNQMSNLIRKYEIRKKDYPTVIDKKIDEAVKRYMEGESLRSIAKNLHIDYPNMRHQLHQRKILLRSLEKDIINKKFGKLLVIKKINTLEYLCRCECGDEKIYPKKRLLDKTKAKNSCGRKSCKISERYYGYEEISGTYWGNIVSGAKYRNIEISIDAKEAWELYLIQGKKCKITGLSIEMPKTKNKKMLKLDDFVGPYVASLDRIDSSKGYITGNIQWVMKEINRMKMNMEDNLFVKLCKIVVEGQSNEKNIMDI